MQLRRVDSFGDMELFPYDIDLENEIQKNIAASYDERIQDIIFLLLEDVIENQLDTIETLIEDENHSNQRDGLSFFGYRLSFDLGTEQSLEDLFQCYSYVWNSYVFIESTGMTFEQQLWFDELRESISNVDEFFFWTMRLCGWGGYDFKHTYSFYKRLSQGKMKAYYDCPEEIRSWFIPDK